MKNCSARTKAAVPASLVMVQLLVLASISAGWQAHGMAHAEDPGIAISIDRQTYHHCEKMSYTVSVPEVTGQMAIMHIIDKDNKSSQAIPIPIEERENEINAPFPFERPVFPAGTYTINMAYAGSNATAVFELVDAGNVCIPGQIKQIAAGWVTGTLSDGFMIDAIKRSVDPSLIDVPFEINRDNIYRIAIPQWVKTVTYWWITDEISDSAIAGVFDYMLQSGNISILQQHPDNNNGGVGSGSGMIGGET